MYREKFLPPVLDWFVYMRMKNSQSVQFDWSKYHCPDWLGPTVLIGCCGALLLVSKYANEDIAVQLQLDRDISAYWL